MPKEVKIRPYRERDRDRILRITEENFADFCLDCAIEERYGLIAGTSWQERKRSGIEHDLRRYPEHALVAEVGELVVGYVCTRTYRTTSIGHVANMAVDRQFQGRGIGRKLLKAALDHFRECGLKYARVETLEQNFKGRNLYPSVGFEQVGRQVFYFREL